MALQTAYSLTLSRCLNMCWMNVGKSEPFHSWHPCFQNSGLRSEIPCTPTPDYGRPSKTSNVSVSQKVKNFPSLSQERVKSRLNLSAEIATMWWLNPLVTLSEPFLTEAISKGGTAGFLKALCPHMTQSPYDGIVFVPWVVIVFRDWSISLWVVIYLLSCQTIPHSTLQIHVTVMNLSMGSQQVSLP